MMSDRALMRAKQPSFQQGGHAVDMRKQILTDLWCVARDRVMVAAKLAARCLAEACISSQLPRKIPALLVSVNCIPHKA